MFYAAWMYRCTQRRSPSHLLPKAERDKDPFEAMPYEDVPAFLRLLQTRSSVSARALRLPDPDGEALGRGEGATW